jgi:hypothetical protein
MAAALEPIAQAAAVRPLVFPKGSELLHMVSTSTMSGQKPITITSEVYIATDGWTWRKDTEAGRETFWMLFNPTVTDYGVLPTDPVALDAVLRKGTGNNSADERVFKAITEILGSRTATPAVRATAIRVLDNISKHPQKPVTTREGQVATPKVELERVTVNGRPSVKATQTDATSRPGVSYYLVLDEETGDIVDGGSVSPGAVYSGSTSLREVVAALPDEMVSVLGTKRVHKEIWR